MGNEGVVKWFVGTQTMACGELLEWFERTQTMGRTQTMATRNMVRTQTMAEKFGCEVFYLF